MWMFIKGDISPRSNFTTKQLSMEVLKSIDMTRIMQFSLLSGSAFTVIV